MNTTMADFSSYFSLLFDVVLMYLKMAEGVEKTKGGEYDQRPAESDSTVNVAGGIGSHDSGMLLQVMQDASVPMVVGSSRWTMAQETGTVISSWIDRRGRSVVAPILLPWTLYNHKWEREPYFLSCFSHHALYRCGFSVEVSTHGTQFHGGSLLVIGVPRPRVRCDEGTWTLLDVGNFGQLLVFPHGRIVPRNNASVTLNLPFVGPGEHIQTNAATVMWAVLVVVETPLQVAQEMTKTTLDVLVTVTPRDVSFVGPTLRHYTDITSDLRFAMWDFVAFDPVSEISEPVAVAMYQIGIDPGPGNVMLWKQPEVIPFPGTHRGLSYLPPPVEDFRSVLSRPTILDIVEVTGEATPGSLLMLGGVSPTMTLITGGSRSVWVDRQHNSSYLSNFSGYCGQWRGSILITMEHTGPAITSGRLVLGFVPGVSVRQAVGVDLWTLMGSRAVEWDLSAAPAVTLEIPFAAPSTWMRVCDLARSVRLGEITGVFYCGVLETVLIPTTSTSSIRIVVMISGGSDFQLRGFGPHCMSNEPMYQSPVEELASLSVQAVMSTQRLAMAGVLGNQHNGVASIPMSLCTFNVGHVQSNPFYVFANLMTMWRGTLELTLKLAFTGTFHVTYLPPGRWVNPNRTPVNLLTIGDSVLVPSSTRSGVVQFSIPYPGLSPVQCTTSSMLRTRYAVARSYFPDDGDLGTLLISGAPQNCKFLLYLGLVDAVGFLPRPFPRLQYRTIRTGDIYPQIGDTVRIDREAPGAPQPSRREVRRERDREVAQYQGGPVNRYWVVMYGSSQGFYDSRSRAYITTVDGLALKYYISKGRKVLYLSPCEDKWWMEAESYLGEDVGVDEETFVTVITDIEFDSRYVWGVLKSGAHNGLTLDKIRNRECADLQVSVQVNSPGIEQVGTSIKEAVSILQEYAPTVSQSVVEAAKSVKGTASSIEQLSAEVLSVVESVKKSIDPVVGCRLVDVAGFCCKLLGAFLILVGNPSGVTIAGLTAMFFGDIIRLGGVWKTMFGAVKKFKTKMICLLCGLFGVCPPTEVLEDTIRIGTDIGECVGAEAPEEAEDDLDPEVQEAVEYQAATKHFNETMTAMRNLDWALSRVYSILTSLLNILKKHDESDIDSFVKRRGKYMNNLFEESVLMLSANDVQLEVAEAHLHEARCLLDWGVANQSHMIVNLMTKTVDNYVKGLRRLRMVRSTPRAEPVVLFVHGDPGVGKSIVSNVVASALCKHYGWDRSSSVFFQPPASDHFDGYNGQPVHIIDDFCQDSSSRDVQLFCQMVSSCRFTPPMAALEDKGVEYTSKVIIATSNLPRPVSTTVRTPGALERRCTLNVQAVMEGRNQMLNPTEAFRIVGPAQRPYVKYDTPFFNGESIKFNVGRGGDVLGIGSREVLSLYEMIDVLIDEIDKRSQCSCDIEQVLYQQPLPIGPKTQIAVLGDTKLVCCNYMKLSTFEYNSEKELLDDLKPYLPQSVFGGGWHACECNLAGCSKIVKESGECVDCTTPSLRSFLLKHYGYEPGDFKSAIARTGERIVQFVDDNKKWLKWGLIALGTVTTVLGLVITCRSKFGEGVQVQAPYDPNYSRRSGKRKVRIVKPHEVDYQSELPQIWTAVERNSVPVFFDNMALTGFGLHDNYMVVNHHALSLSDTMTVCGKKFKLDDLQCRRLVRGGKPTDLVVVQLPLSSNIRFKNMSRYLRSVNDGYNATHGMLLNKSHDVVQLIEVNNIALGRRVVSEGDAFEGVISYSASTKRGTCGAPLIASCKGLDRVLGIHFAGGSNKGYAVPLYKEDCEVVFQALYVPTDEVAKSVHVPRKTALFPSPAYGCFQVKKGPAVLSRNDHRLGEGVDFEDVIMSKHTKSMSDREVKLNEEGWDTLKAGVDYVVNKIMRTIGAGRKSFKMLTVEQALNGYGVMEGMDMSQSPGYPHNTCGVKRRDLFFQKDDKWYPKPEVEKQIMRELEDFGQSKFTTFLKDELRSQEKIVAGKTRVIDADRVERVVAMRMVFGQFFEAMLRNHGTGVFCAVGCDPDVFWTRLYYEVGPTAYAYLYDFDYRNFDSHQPKAVFKMLASALQPWFEADVIKPLMSLAVSRHVYETEVYELHGGMPSGCVGTSIFNSIHNAAFIASALIAVGVDVEQCSWICYGDDLLLASDVECLAQKIADFMNTTTCLEITPADKGEKFRDDSSIFDVTFLKRKFQPDTLYPHLIHPRMDEDVLEQSVMWQTDGDFEQKFFSLCFLAFHSGRKWYEQFIERVVNVCEEKGVDLYPPSFDFLMTIWYMKFR
ncbi:polyprotein [poecivirus A1]|uniref:Genome polyprotein n=1 Tax=poecivirus A1 TaxID=2848036 RepID=A0A1B1H1K2_9PICO|nr:polyprotein [poecivirus A1]ANQ80547.1 polyprotein [poecivirus A1]